MNFNGLKDSIVELLAGGRKKINTNTFSNDMTTFHSADDVLTLLIHLGYLGYDFRSKEVFIPNSEISSEFYNAISSTSWDTVIASLKKSETLLNATLNKDAEQVASIIRDIHMETSILTYNDENALSYTLGLAYYSAREYYLSIRELPAGKGFADIVLIPRKNHTEKPAIVLELKWDKSAQTATSQIHKRCYVKSLANYTGTILLVGINYTPKTKEHQCIIEEYQK